jgi:hypothetical protein
MSHAPRSLPAAAALLACAAGALAQQTPSPSPTPAPPAPQTNGAEPKPWRLNQALGTPAWLKVSGEQRSRWENLDNQFRTANNAAGNAPGESEDALALRTSIRLDATGEHASGTLEILDAHQFWTEDSSPVDTTMVNVADVLQAYADVHLGRLGGGKHALRLGREAVDLGNRRLMARNAYRNTINAFTGANWLWNTEQSNTRAFWTLPVDRRPNDFEALQDNEWQEDNQDFGLDLQFWGVYHDLKLSDRSRFEVYVFGLNEDGERTREREVYSPGVRFVRNPQRGSVHGEVELTGQIGNSKVNTNPTSPKLDHLAGFAMAAVGYTFDYAWQPGLTANWHWASGDQDPNDDTNERYDTLFGARRFEYGPTGIWGAVARSNLNSPELRFTLRPSQTVDVMFAWRGVWLASERDSWTVTNRRDTTGRSGSEVAQQYEARVRWDVLPRSFHVEVGAAYLQAGSFQEEQGSGYSPDATYFYLQTTWTL